MQEISRYDVAKGKGIVTWPSYGGEYDGCFGGICCLYLQCSRGKEGVSSALNTGERNVGVHPGNNALSIVFKVGTDSSVIYMLLVCFGTVFSVVAWPHMYKVCALLGGETKNLGT
jgi:hypothetical protein